MKQCEDSKHQIHGHLNEETGLPLMGKYSCLICSCAIIVLDNDGTFRIEPSPRNDRCPMCDKPEDDHHNNGSDLIFCGIGERPEIPEGG